MVIDVSPSIEKQHDHWENFTNKRKYDHPVVTFFAKQRIDFISTFIPLNKIKNALDVGSGLGWSAAHFPKNINMTVTDFSPNQLRHNPVQKQVICNSDDMPFEDKSFSLVYGWEFLHHVPDPFKTVEEMSRVASDYLVLLEPNRNNPAMFLYGVLKNHERATLKFHKKMMYQLVKNIKFDILACETVGCTFAGSTPQFMLPLIKKLPYRIPIVGTSNILICKRRE
ncbi:MAG: class I SAM-dependent methyltransferase [Thaumarchaeota archaeon]|nr:class I SAM-dependent methyltransferase [Nitrososphaerota archaeon]